MKERGAFKVLCDTYVTEESGTGVVHQAPYFGEVTASKCSYVQARTGLLLYLNWKCDIFIKTVPILIVLLSKYMNILQDDYRVSLAYGIITKDMKPLCPLDLCGRFTEPVEDFKGQYVKVCRAVLYRRRVRLTRTKLEHLPMVVLNIAGCRQEHHQDVERAGQTCTPESNNT